jgi:hypothetical protein
LTLTELRDHHDRHVQQIEINVHQNGTDAEMYAVTFVNNAACITTQSNGEPAICAVVDFVTGHSWIIEDEPRPELHQVIQEAIAISARIERRPYSEDIERFSETGKVVVHGGGVFKNGKLEFRQLNRTIAVDVR